MMWGYGPWFNNGTVGAGNFWWMGLVMMAAQIIFWGLLIWFGVSLFRRAGGGNYTANGRNDALDLLRERYARGEIDTEEFQRRKEGLLR